MNSKIRRFLFGQYSYLDFLFQILLNFMPPSIRKFIFKLTLGFLGKNSYIDYQTYIRYPWKVIIGDNVEINRKCSIIPSYFLADARIIIEDGVIIGPQVTLIGAGQDPDNPTKNVGGSIHIEKNVYIGANSTIRYGVVIGKGSVVAAGSVVVKNVAPYSVVSGVPAKFLRMTREPLI